MKAFFKYFTLLDIIVIFFVFIAISFFSFSTLKKSKTTPVQLRVTAAGQIYFFSLAKDQVFEVNGKIGKTKIEIKNGAARILFSPCPNKTCMARPAISKNGEWLACLPNEVLLEIQ